MKWFYDLGISKKLISSFILIALISGAMGAYGIYNIKLIDISDTELYENMTVPVSQMGEISTEFERLRVSLRDMIIAESPEDIQVNMKKVEERRTNIDKLSESFEKTILSAEIRKEFEKFKASRIDFKLKLDKATALINESKYKEVAVMIGENGEIGISARAEQEVIEKIVSMKIEDAKAKSDSNSKNANITIAIMIGVIIFVMLMSLLIGVYISRLIIKPLKRVVYIIGEMSKGHLGERLNMNSKDEIGQMSVVMDLFADDLQNSVIGNMKKVSNGDVSMNIYSKDEKDEISPALNKMVENIRELVKDTNVLSKAAIEGRLDRRVDTTKHNGEFRNIVEGVNQLIEAMVKPIQEVTSVMSEISKGNLEVSVSEGYQGEFGILARSVNDTEESLNSVLNEINNAAEQVFTGAGQVSDGSQALSQGATEQASAIEQLTSSITEIASQTKENAVNANEAKNLALNVKGNAEEGNRHMSEMLKSMAEINESSASVYKIIKVIDEIAFQTNILALNAAVEAARAGQHGKGFAVVAEEVRNLAARSANAAKETTDLIEGSIKKAEKGTEIANNTAKALDEIVGGVSKAAVLVAEIAASSNEQAIGISQINLGIEQVSQVVQTNSATAEQSAAASEELSSQSELLKDMVSSFKLKNSGNKHGLLNSNFKPKNRQYYSEAYEEAAISSMSKISLNDNEFDKY